MKQKLFIFVVLALLITLLAGLNAATYVQKEKVPDTEFAPNRSTYNPGSTGTLALYSLLSETGRKVVRWQISLETIASETKNRPAVFVMIGPLRRPLDAAESTQLMEWVSDGGTLVLVDRDPSADLVMSTSQWQMSVASNQAPELLTVDATDQKQMTAGTPARKPAQPSYFSHGVNAVQPSRFASDIKFERFADHAISTSTPSPSPTPHDFYTDDRTAADDEAMDETSETESDEKVPAFDAPIVHVAGSGGSLLVESPFGRGRVVVLADPYVVSNAGINLADNSRLAVNLVTSRDGIIAFDEYHHGYGANNNRFFQYFEGTPVVAIFIQCGLLVALLFISQSRRFARPVRVAEPNRLAKLEYVAAMAELQQRSRAYDLAIENIYLDFRRRAATLVGLDNTTATRKDIAVRIAERIRGNAGEIEGLLFECEDVIHGEPIDKRATVALIDRVRRLEDQLGLKRARKGA